MRVLHTIQSFSKAGAGVFYFVRDLTQWQRRFGLEVSVSGLSDANGLQDAHLWSHVDAQYVPIVGLPFFPLAPRYVDMLHQIKPDIIHCHGLWTYHGFAVPTYSRKTNTPFIVSPHGMLEPWAWRHHAWKKRPIWWLWEQRFLRRATALHATAARESNNLDRFAFHTPRAVIPAGVDIPLTSHIAATSRHRTKIALFLSRIHPVKGLLDLVRAWSITRPEGWRAIIAGPDSNGHLDEVQQAVTNANLKVDFEFQGPVYDAEKWALYQSADLFVLPTYSENFGIVIAEALASGIPVITTRETPWSKLVQNQCGWWIEVGPEHLAKALKEATTLSDIQRHEMGLRGRKLVEEHFSWNTVSRDMLGLYQWVLGQGPKPASVALNGCSPYQNRAS